MRKHSWTFLLPALALALLPLAANAAEPDKPSKTSVISAYVGPSIAYIEVTWKASVYDPYVDEWIPTGLGKNAEAKVFESTHSCTGFVVNADGYISTAGHCVDPKEVAGDMIAQAARWALELGYYEKGTTFGKLVKNQGLRVYTTAADSDRENADRDSIFVAFGAAEDQQHRARLIRYEKAAKGDTALLKIDETNLLAARLAKTSDLEVGSEVVSIGYPAKVDQAVDADFNPSYKDGEISSKKTREGGLFSVYEVSSALSGGMSGGPTANLDGEVIGFNSFIAADEIQESEQFGFIGTSNMILELMNDAGVKNDIGTRGRNYTAGLKAYFDGDKDAAVENLQAAADEGPENETVKSYLAKAKKLPDPFPIALVAGLAAVGILLVAAVVIVLVRRTRGGSGGPGGSPTDAATTPPAPVAGVPQEPTTPQPVTTTSTMVAEPVEPPTRTSGFQPPPTSQVEPTVETPDPTAPAEAPHAQYCSSCGSQIGPTAKYCPSCGTPVQS